MSIAATIRLMIEEDGLTFEQALKAAERMESALSGGNSGGIPVDNTAEKRRAYDRERKRKAKSEDSGGIPVEQVSSSIPKEKIPHTPLKEITLNSTIPANRESASARDFTEFWDLYPNKVGKGIAEKSFFAARRRADQPTLIAGLHRYIESKPPDRDWCNPSTWLNQQRWLDAPANPQSIRRENRNERPNGFSAAFDRLEARIVSRTNHEPEEPERRDSSDDFGGRLQLVARSDF